MHIGSLSVLKVGIDENVAILIPLTLFLIGPIPYRV